MAQSVVGGDSVVVKLVDNSTDGLDVILDNFSVVSEISTTSTGSMESLPQLGSKKMINIPGSVSHTINLTVVPTYQMNGDQKDYLRYMEKLSKAVNRPGLTLFLTFYEPGTEDDPDRDQKVKGYVTFHNVILNSKSGGHSAGAATSQVQLSGAFDEVTYDY